MGSSAPSILSGWMWHPPDFLVYMSVAVIGSLVAYSRHNGFAGKYRHDRLQPLQDRRQGPSHHCHPPRFTALG